MQNNRLINARSTAFFFIFLAAANFLFAEGNSTPMRVEAVGIVQYLPFIGTFFFWAGWVAFLLKLGTDDSKDRRGSWAEKLLPGWEVSHGDLSQGMSATVPFSSPSLPAKTGPKDKSVSSPTHHAA